LYLIGIGSALAIGRLLASSERITFRLMVGRALVGGILSLPAGLLLLTVPNLNPLALVAAGAALGILGEQGVERWLSSKLGVQR
jgi:hypothetical protein